MNISSILQDRHLSPGFAAITDPRYILRPEAIESIFVLYRITGERYLLDAAWRMFNIIQNATEAEFGNAGITDVTATAKDGSPKFTKQDRQESFWLAETLKYFYLIFSEPELISLDDWVFNTKRTRSRGQNRMVLHLQMAASKLTTLSTPS